MLRTKSRDIPGKDREVPRFSLHRHDGALSADELSHPQRVGTDIGTQINRRISGTYEPSDDSAFPFLVELGDEGKRSTHGVTRVYDHANAVPHGKNIAIFVMRAPQGLHEAVAEARSVR